MDFGFTDDQQLLLTSLQSMLQPFRTPPAGAHAYVQYSAALQEELALSGFLEVASQPEFGPLEGALLIEEIASCPMSVEIGSALIAPLINRWAGPIAVVWELGAPTRFLTIANTVCIMRGESVLLGTPDPRDIEQVDSVVAYPLGRLGELPRDCVHVTGKTAAAIRRRALVAIAAEAAGAMRGALDQTVAYVKDRQVFGQSLAQFQAVQHRLAEDAQLVHACRSLALRAAWQDDDTSAAVACLYAQDVMRKLIYDCHQFTGATGLTLEYPLHLWSYRLKHLQGEAGGKGRQANLVSECVWDRRESGSSPLAASGV
jgi:alkylation response protein AidB-like acyl-CoA dehydrogenase